MFIHPDMTGKWIIRPQHPQFSGGAVEIIVLIYNQAIPTAELYQIPSVSASSMSAPTDSRTATATRVITASSGCSEPEKTPGRCPLGINGERELPGRIESFG